MKKEGVLVFSINNLIIVECIDSRDAFAVHIEICNGLNLFGNKNRKILIAKSLVFIGKVAEGISSIFEKADKANTTERTHVREEV